jgi:uncharacterized coiled-coil protein SlyX
MNPLIQPKQLKLFVFALGFVWLGLLPKAEALSPAPDGGYPGQNTAEGSLALLHLNGGTYNTAVGWSSLGFNVIGDLNTAVGAATLLSNTVDANTATGAGALLNNTTGGYNTANGVFALFSNTTGHDNAATGDYALYNNITGSNNTAFGRIALDANTSGDGNAAYGDEALDGNTAGSNNTAIGTLAGKDLTTGNNNIDIGYNVVGLAGESNTIRIGNTNITDAFIRGISGTTVASGDAVLVASNGHLGTITSSRRFKQDIKPMDKASEALFSLKPVTFHYKQEIDPAGSSQFGLVAEDVERVNSDLVTRDENGKVNSVRYDKVNAMLLNEFLKEHRTVRELKGASAQQDTTIAALSSMVVQQENEIRALSAQVKEQAVQLKNVSVQMEVSKASSRVVRNDP